jgi:hypothetical protein
MIDESDWRYAPCVQIILDMNPAKLQAVYTEVTLTYS